MDTNQVLKRLSQIKLKSGDYVSSMKIHLHELALHNPLLIERTLLILSCLMVLWLKQRGGSP